MPRPAASPRLSSSTTPRTGQSSAGAARNGSCTRRLRRLRDLLIEKSLPGSFTNTPLDEWLRERGITTVSIAGYMTHMCCDTTARQAVHRGFKSEFLRGDLGT